LRTLRLNNGVSPFLGGFIAYRFQRRTSDPS